MPEHGYVRYGMPEENSGVPKVILFLLGALLGLMAGAYFLHVKGNERVQEAQAQCKEELKPFLNCEARADDATFLLEQCSVECEKRLDDIFRRCEAQLELMDAANAITPEQVNEIIRVHDGRDR